MVKFLENRDYIIFIAKVSFSYGLASVNVHQLMNGTIEPGSKTSLIKST